jgi:chromosome segregation ATPase
MSNALSLLLALGFAAATAWFVRAWQIGEKKNRDLAARLETLEAERKELARRIEQESQARKRQSEELALLRQKAEKSKRRAEKTPELPLGTAARIRDVELEVERAVAGLRRAEAERDEQARRAEGLRGERDRLAQRLEEAIAPIEVVAEQGRAEVEKARAELALVKEQALKLGEELALVRQTEARMRKRMDNQEQLYVSLRAELEVKKDRLRTQEEQIQRLEALKVVVVP